jgi:hypothetical protein
MFFDLLPTLSTFILHVKTQLFVILKSDSYPIRIRIEINSWTLGKPRTVLYAVLMF